MCMCVQDRSWGGYSFSTIHSIWEVWWVGKNYLFMQSAADCHPICHGFQFHHVIVLSSRVFALLFTIRRFLCSLLSNSIVVFVWARRILIVQDFNLHNLFWIEEVVIKKYSVKKIKNKKKLRQRTVLYHKSSILINISKTTNI